MARGREWDFHTQSGSWNWRQAPRQRKKTWSRDSCPTKCTHFRDASHPAEGPHDTEEINVYLTSKKLLSIPGTRRVERENDWGKTVGIFFFFGKWRYKSYKNLSETGGIWEDKVMTGRFIHEVHVKPLALKETPRNTSILLQRLPDHNPA